MQAQELFTAQLELEALFKTPPRYKFFRTSTALYVYDANTSEFLTCEPVFEVLVQALGTDNLRETLLQATEQFGVEEVLSAVDNIIDLRTSRKPPFLTCTIPAKLQLFPTFEEYVDEISHKLRQMILCVTAACDNDCAYCFYHNTEYLNARRSAAPMSLETMRLSLDCFVQHSGEAEQPCLTFYGGEPTLQMELIRNAIAYVGRQRGENWCRYAITSNFVNVTEEMLQLLIDHNFLLSISLDGPKDVHDRYRKDKSGKPTFDRIMANLENLKRLDETYWRERVLFVSTLAPPYEFGKVHDFFVENTALPHTRGHAVNMASLPDTDEWIGICPEQGLEGLVDLENKFCDYALRGLLSQNLGPSFDNHATRLPKDVSFIQELFHKSYLFAYRRPRIDMSEAETLRLRASCLPGKRKLFVRYDGKFFPCEKSPELDALCIGDCHRGIDAKKAYQLLLDFHRLTKEECLHCWAYNVCNEVCFVHVYDQKTLAMSSEVKRLRCELFLKNMERVFTNMLSIHEKNAKGLAFLNSYVVF